MALGTITVAVSAGAAPSAPTFADRISVPLDNSYPTGGYAFDVAFQQKVKATRKPLGFIAGDCAGYFPVYDPAAGKLKIYYIDNNNAADGPMIEVPNATDLSAITLNMVVLSQ